MKKKWWHDKVAYQIYPKSFLDTNGDGIGDLGGIISKLDYLKELGIDVIWLSPVYQSPNDDNGYDISDYQAIMEEFGTMEDMKILIQKCQDNDIKIIMDLVVNHTSDEHPWFIEAKKSLDNPYRDYYIWRKGEDGQPPNDLMSNFGGSAWEYSPETNEYYLHFYSKKQPDLNWENPKLRQEIYDMMNWWLDQGIAGFRMDVIDLIGKIPDQKIKENGPMLHKYLHEMNEATFGSDDSFMTVGEMSSTTIDNCVLYSAPERQELSMAFNFHHLKVDYEDGQKWTIAPFDFEELKRLYHTWGKEMSDRGGWSALFWNNHDQPRALNRFVDIKNFRNEGATMLAASIHLSRGTPYIYMGEEIGMIDPEYDSMADYVDVESINAYQMLLDQGKSPEQAFKIIQAKSRDNSRTPMQWDASLNAGFSTGTPWLKVGKSYKDINVENEIDGPIFKFYKELIRLRKEMPIISEGSYQPALEDSKQVYAFERHLDDQKLLVLNNFYGSEAEVEIPEEYQAGRVLLSNYDDAELAEKVSLKPYQTLAILVK